MTGSTKERMYSLEQIRAMPAPPPEMCPVVWAVATETANHPARTLASDTDQERLVSLVHLSLGKPVTPELSSLRSFICLRYALDAVRVQLNVLSSKLPNLLLPVATAADTEEASQQLSTAISAVEEELVCSMTETRFLGAAHRNRAWLNRCERVGVALQSLRRVVESRSRKAHADAGLWAMAVLSSCGAPVRSSLQCLAELVAAEVP